MSTIPNAPWPSGAWRKHLADAVTDVDELLDLLGLDASIYGDPAAALLATDSFGLRVPRGFIRRIKRGDRNDPLLRQILPMGLENQQVSGFVVDPVGELRKPSAAGVLHKYHGRALVMTTGACAVHCRYCFRRHFPYAEPGSVSSGWSDAIDLIAADPTVSEAILSGGDPLTVPDSRLEVLGRQLAAIPHLRRLRIHTRLPIVLPQRVDGALTSWIGGLGLPVVVVVHINHAHEIDGDVRRALAALSGTGVTLLNQSVLLRGVNDSAEVLAELSEALFESGVLPYYLHMLDPVAGAAHFDVPEAEANSIFENLCARLPGYLVPRLVREVPGAPSKVGVVGPRSF